MIVNRISSAIGGAFRCRGVLGRGADHLGRAGQVFGMLIRHTPCFLLLPLVDHPVSVVFAPFVAALVAVVGLVPRPTPTRLVFAVRAPVIARAADDELVPAPPANDPSRLRAHRSSWRTQRTSYRSATRAIDRSHRSARGSGRNPGPLLFVAARSPTDLPRRPRRTRIHGAPPHEWSPGPGDRGGSGILRRRWRQKSGRFVPGGVRAGDYP